MGACLDSNSSMSVQLELIDILLCIFCFESAHHHYPEDSHQTSLQGARVRNDEPDEGVQTFRQLASCCTDVMNGCNFPLTWQPHKKLYEFSTFLRGWNVFLSRSLYTSSQVALLKASDSWPWTRSTASAQTYQTSHRFTIRNGFISQKKNLDSLMLWCRPII